MSIDLYTMIISIRIAIKLQILILILINNKQYSVLTHTVNTVRLTLQGVQEVCGLDVQDSSVFRFLCVPLHS